MEQRELIFRLSHCRGIGRASIRRVITYFARNEHNFSIENLPLNDLSQLLHIPVSRVEAFREDWCRFNSTIQHDRYRQKQIGYLTQSDSKFPTLLREIPDAPLILYYTGNLDLLKNQKALSVVGTRQPTKEGLRVMEHLLNPLIDQGWQLISGMAKGVDGFAHSLALRSQTIAVLGSGLDYVYPIENTSLFQQLVKNHLVLSEYMPTVKPQKWMFPERNRLISGLSMGTLVVEAKERSGSLITADQALEQGREVLAIPGSIFNPMAQGTNRLIKQGAVCVTCSEDILQTLGHYTEFNYSVQGVSTNILKSNFNQPEF